MKKYPSRILHSLVVILWGCSLNAFAENMNPFEQELRLLEKNTITSTTTPEIIQDSLSTKMAANEKKSLEKIPSLELKKDENQPKTRRVRSR